MSLIILSFKSIGIRSLSNDVGFCLSHFLIVSLTEIFFIDRKFIIPSSDSGFFNLSGKASLNIFHRLVTFPEPVQESYRRQGWGKSFE